MENDDSQPQCSKHLDKNTQKCSNDDLKGEEDNLEPLNQFPILNPLRRSNSGHQQQNRNKTKGGCRKSFQSYFLMNFPSLEGCNARNIEFQPPPKINPSDLSSTTSLSSSSSDSIQNKKTSNIDESEELNFWHPSEIPSSDVDISDGSTVEFVRVLRHLVNLEEELHLLNVKIHELLEKALEMERRDKNSSEILLNDAQNLELLKLILKNLKYYLRENCIEQTRIAAVKKAINDLSLIIPPPTRFFIKKASSLKRIISLRTSSEESVNGRRKRLSNEHAKRKSRQNTLNSDRGFINLGADFTSLSEISTTSVVCNNRRPSIISEIVEEKNIKRFFKNFIKLLYHFIESYCQQPQYVLDGFFEMTMPSYL